MKEIPPLESKEKTEGMVVIIDVSNAENPKIISSIPLPGKPLWYNNMVVRDKHIILTTSYGVHIIDVENPNEPKQVADLPLKGARNISIWGKYAFILSNMGLYAVLDIENPTELLQISHHGSEQMPMFSGKRPLLPGKGFQVKDGYAYFIDRNSRVRVSKFFKKQNDAPGIRFTSEPLKVSWNFPLFLIQEQDVKPVLDKLPLHTDLSPITIPPEMRTQLSNRTSLLDIRIPGEFKAEMSEYICFWFSHPLSLQDSNDGGVLSLDKRLWIIPPENDRVYPFDLPTEYTKRLYLSGKKKLPKDSSVTGINGVKDVYYIATRNGGLFTFISRDNWVYTVDVDPPDIIGRIADFKLSSNHVYITTEDGRFLVAKLSPHRQFEVVPNMEFYFLNIQNIAGIVSILDLPYRPQSMALDKNNIYLLCSMEKEKDIFAIE